MRPCSRLARLRSGLVVLGLLAAAPLAAQPTSTLRTSASGTLATVRDSVRMTRKVYSWFTHEGGGYQCGAYIYATWPDVLVDLGLPGGYGRYSRVAVGGTSANYVPYGYGQATNDPSINLIVPEGFLAHAPQLGGHAVGPGNGDGCPGILASAQSSIPNGPMRVLNAAPFQITDWYAVFTIPDGTPISLFTWDQRRGLDVAFDGSFASKQSHEADALAPGGKRPVVSYAWDFGDGASGSGDRPSHTYDSTGTYTVALTVTDDDGQTATHREAIEVRGGVLAVRVQVEQTERQVGDTLTVVATVTNTGDEAVHGVSADRVFVNNASYPAAANVPGDRFQDPTLEAVGERAKVTFATLEPDDSFEVRAQYLVKTPGKYRPTGTAVYEPFEAELRSTLSNLTAQTEDGAPARVVNDCETTACDNVWKVVPEVYTFELAFKAAPENSLAAQEVTAVKSGLTAGPSGALSVVARHRVRTADLSDQICRSGCVEVEVTVRDEDGQPADNVEVSLSAPLITIQADFGAVTSGQRGRFCNFDADATGTLCGNPLRGFTDAEGRLHRTYLTPGVISDVPVEIKAEPFDANIVGEAKKTLTIQPNVVRELTLDINDATSRALMAALGVRGFSGLAELPATFCKGVGTFLGTTAGVVAPRLQQLPYLEGVSTNALEWACGKLPNHAIAEVLAQGKPLAELVPLTWLLESTQLPGTGLASIAPSVNVPFVKVEDDFTPHVSDALKALAQANPAPISPYLLLRRSVDVKIYEVSHLTDTSRDLAGTEKSTYGLYVDIGGQTKLVRAGYDARIWLQEGALAQQRPTLGSAASAGDTEITVGGADAPPRADGTAPNGLRIARNRAGTTATDTLEAGDLVALGAGGPGGELVQVWSVTGSTVRLTTPLRHAHAADETLHVLGQRAVAAPERPLAYAPTDTTAATTRPLLQWSTLVPAESFDVQVAPDTTFATLVQTHADVTADSLRLAGLTEGETYAWRVRARNGLGQSAWSRPSTFVAEVPALPVELTALTATADGDAVLLQWTTQSETGNAGFEVQRADGDAFRTLAFVEGHGTTAEAHHYGVRLTGLAPGLHRFRLKQVDLDGTIAYSPEVEASVGMTAPLVLAAPSPNPFTAQTTLRFAAAGATPVRLVLYNALGQEVRVLFEGVAPAGQVQTVRLDGAGLTGGVYFARLTGTGAPLVQRLVLLR